MPTLVELNFDNLLKRLRGAADHLLEIATHCLVLYIRGNGPYVLWSCLGLFTEMHIQYKSGSFQLRKDEIGDSATTASCTLRCHQCARWNALEKKCVCDCSNAEQMKKFSQVIVSTFFWVLHIYLLYHPNHFFFFWKCPLHLNRPRMLHLCHADGNDGNTCPHAN
jgi:hypothetical protein